MSFTALKTIRPFFTNDCGRLLAGGKVYSYEPGTLTPKPTYKDAAGLTENTNPIILDASGEADIYINSDYRFQIFDRDGVLIDDIDLVAATQRVSSEFVLDASGLTQGQINNDVRLEQGQPLTPIAVWSDVLSLVDQSGAPSIHDIPVQALLNRIQMLYESKESSANKAVPLGYPSLDENTKVPVIQQYEASTTQKGVTQLVNDLTTGGTDKALTAEQGKLLFQMFASSKAANGYQKLPSGLIIQWGTFSGNGSTTTPVTWTYPIAFPNAPLNILATPNSSGPTIFATQAANVPSKTSVGFVSTATSGVNHFCFAIGY